MGGAVVAEGLNQWELFGVDTRSLGQYWVQAWREFLFVSNSPIRRNLDEVVELFDGDQRIYVRNGEHVEPPSTIGPCRAFLVPEHVVLTRELNVPVSALGELQSVIDIELSALSPFSRDDTVSGWCEIRRADGIATFALAVCSKIALHRWFQQLDSVSEEEKANAEFWVRAGTTYVEISRSAQSPRDTIYRRRLTRVGLLAAAVLLGLLIVTGLYAFQQKVSLTKVQEVAAVYNRDSESAVRAREELLAANEQLEQAHEVQFEYPNPHLEIARLTRLLKDDTFITHFSMRGSELRLRGRSADAALVMQSLAQDEAYEAVEAVGPITSVGNTGLEQFNLKITVDLKLDASS